jgi:DNA-binding NtrC family response regulator
VRPKQDAEGRLHLDDGLIAHMLAGARILLVDTDPDVRRVLERVLQRASACITATDPAHAAYYGAAIEPQLIVVEGQAVVNGTYLAPLLAAQHPHCPLLILDQVPPNLEKFMQTRSWEWLEKPITPAVLVSAAGRLLRPVESA